MSLTMLDPNGEARGRIYSKGPVWPPPKIWIGFAFAFAFLVSEVVDGAANGAEHESLRGAPNVFA